MNASSSGSSAGLDFNNSEGLRSAPPPPQPSMVSSQPKYQPVQQQQQQPVQQQQQQQQQPQQNEPKYKKLVKYVVVFLDIFFAFLVSATGAIGISSAKSISDSALIFVGLYLILFSAVRFCYTCN